jgi:Icc-related predicted phosphoesterase
LSRIVVVFFATDVHGSNKCFKKFLNAAKFYGANQLVLGGDITGKILVPIVEDRSDVYSMYYLGSTQLLKRGELEATEKMLGDSGAYYFRTTKKEYEELNENQNARMELFRQLMKNRIIEWLSLAEERLKGTNIGVYITGGNDDYPEIEDVLKCSQFVIGAEGKVLPFAEDFEILSSGYSNETPWHCPRDITDEQLGEKIEAMIDKVKNLDRCIFNLHVPPYGTPLDKAPELDANLTPVVNPVSGYNMISVGSKSIRKAIETHQPLLGLHGHIHESRAFVRLGRTLCINPGSEYGEGILRGALVKLDTEKGVIKHDFTAG